MKDRGKNSLVVDDGYSNGNGNANAIVDGNDNDNDIDSSSDNGSDNEYLLDTFEDTITNNNSNSISNSKEFKRQTASSNKSSSSSNSNSSSISNSSSNSSSSMSKLFLMVMLYYPLSIGLTFYQKWFIKTYKLPLLVVTSQYIIKYCIAILIRSILEYRNGKRIRIAFNDQFRLLVPIGICASFDIGLSNWALEYVTVSLYTMAKSSSILFIVAFALFLRLERWRTSLGVAAILIAFGLFLFTWRSTQLDVRGLLLIELAAACTGIRWTVSQMVMQSEQKCSLKHPLDMVTHLQPWMLIAILPLLFLFEGSELSFERVFFYDSKFAPVHILTLMLIGGIIAFSLEMAEYLLLLHTSGITLNIFGIMKEVVTLLLAHFINGDRLTFINIIGLLLCFSGMSLHAISKHPKQTPKILRKLESDSSSIEAADRKSLLNDTEET